MSAGDRVDADKVRAYLESEMQKRIMVIDGAMGTTIQQYKFSEADFRGERSACICPHDDTPHPLRPGFPVGQACCAALLLFRAWRD